MANTIGQGFAAPPTADIGASAFAADVEAKYKTKQPGDFKLISATEFNQLKAEYNALGSSNWVLPASTDKAAARALITGHEPLLAALKSGASYETYAKSINIKDNPAEFTTAFRSGK